jgi:hypothetical protein
MPRSSTLKPDAMRVRRLPELCLPVREMLRDPAVLFAQTGDISIEHDDFDSVLLQQSGSDPSTAKLSIDGHEDMPRPGAIGGDFFVGDLAPTTYAWRVTGHLGDMHERVIYERERLSHLVAQVGVEAEAAQRTSGRRGTLSRLRPARCAVRTSRPLPRACQLRGSPRWWLSAPGSRQQPARRTGPLG